VIDSLTEVKKGIVSLYLRGRSGPSSSSEDPRTAQAFWPQIRMVKRSGGSVL